MRTMKAADVLRRMMMSAASSSTSRAEAAVAAASTTGAAIKLLGPSYTRAYRCLWMLEELRIPYDLDEMARPQSRVTRSYHPTGKVPVLLHYRDGPEASPLVLTESLAINTYLGDTFATAHTDDDKWLSVTPSPDDDDRPPPLCMPVPGTIERIKYDEIGCQILSELDASSLWVHHKHNSPDLSKVFGSIPQITAPCRQNFARTNQLLAPQCRPYLLGSYFTPLDIAYVHCLEWAMREKWNDNESIQSDKEAWPTEQLQPYLELCKSRPAYRRAQQMRKKSIVEQQRRMQQKQQQQQEQPSAPSKL